MRAILIAAVMAGVASPGPGFAAANAPAWLSLGRDREGELFYDPASLRRQGPRVLVTMRAVALTAPTNPPFIMIVEQEIDCATQRSAMLSLKQYGAGPEPVRTRTIAPEAVQRDRIYRDSDLAGLYRIACPKGRPLTDPPKGPVIQVVPPPTSAK